MKNATLVLTAIALALTPLTGYAGYPVTIDGWTGDPQRWANDTKELLQDIRKVQVETVKPSWEELIKMARGSKEIYLAMAQKIALEDYGKVLQKFPSGRVVPADPTSLSFDGTNFIGGNQGFIDNIAGINGLPIAMDRMMPTALVPLAPDSANIFSKALQTATQATASALTQAPAAFLAGMSPDAFVKSFVLGNVASAATQEISKSLVGNGVFVRPYAGVLDDTYAAFANSSDPKLKMATLLQSASSGYLPIAGRVSGLPPGSLGNVNLNNVLSSGAYDAVDAYLKKEGVTNSNPYAVFARDMTGWAVDAVSKAKPGDSIEANARDVSAQQNGEKANSSNPLSNLKAPPLMASAVPLPRTNSSDQSAPAPTSEPSQPQVPPMVAAVTPTAQEAQQRDKLLAESDKRISEVQAQIRRTQAIKTHTYDVIEELNKLVKQAEEIRKKLDNINAVPEITQVVIDLQSEIQRQQNFIHTLDQDLDTLSQRRYELLKDREAAMGAFTDRIQKDARRRVAEAQATVVVYPNESKRPSFFFAAK